VTYCKPAAMMTRNRLGRHADVLDATLQEQSDDAHPWTIELVLEAGVDALATSLLEEIVRRNASVADVSPQGERLVVDVRA